MNLIVSLIVVTTQLSWFYLPSAPPELRECLRREELRDHVHVTEGNNPFYQRGDFNDDGIVDYAAEVLIRDTFRYGLLICEGTGDFVILGGGVDGEDAFSNTPNDRVVGDHHWYVISQSDVEDGLEEYGATRPDALPGQRGDALGMLFDYGLYVVYWDGTGYRWGTP